MDVNDRGFKFTQKTDLQKFFCGRNQYLCNSFGFIRSLWEMLKIGDHLDLDVSGINSVD